MVRQYKPLMRMNNKVMMTINPDPVHLTIGDIVHDLTCMVGDSYHEIDDLLMWTKKEMKKALKEIAQYRSYNYDGREWGHYEYADLNRYEPNAYDKIASKVRAKVLKVFPEFETEAGLPKEMQEAYA